MIQISELTKVYSKNGQIVKALDGIDLEIEKGDIYGIIGLSGAGKSSLIRCINRIEEPSSGRVVISGVDITALSDKELRKSRQNIGMIFQNFNLLSSKTVYDNIAFPLRLQKYSEAVIREKVTSLLEKVELTDKANVYPSNLSGGQKQRVGIARALATEPEILLCDEATSALDPKTTKQILSLLKSLSNALGITLVVITHEMEVIKAICNKVAILEAGKIIEKGVTAELFSTVPTPQTRHFLGELEAPEFLSQKGTRLHLTFSNGSANAPIISGFIRQFPYDVNILSGNIESIQRQVVGKLLIEVLTPSEDDMDRVIAYFEDQHVVVEVL